MKRTLLAIPSMLEASVLFPDFFTTETQNNLYQFSSEVDIGVLGVGLVDFGVGLIKQLSFKKYERVVQVGICGAFVRSGLNLGDVVFVEEDCIGDFGAEESDGHFISFNSIMKTRFIYHSSIEPFFSFPLLPRVKAVSVNCCTGTQTTADFREQNHQAQIETMEGASCFAFAEAMGYKAYQIRAVSNWISDRNISQWKTKEALQSLKHWINSWINAPGSA